jgi:hypothetical protein
LNDLSNTKANLSGASFTGNIAAPNITLNTGGTLATTHLTVNTGITIPNNALTIDKILNLSTDLGNKAPKENPSFTGTVAGITKAMVGLGDVYNTSDASKIFLQSQISGLTTALGNKANTASPSFTGTVGGITAAMVGLGNVNNTSDSPVLYRCKKENYPELKEDLILTEYHAILVDHLTEIQKEKTIKKLGEVYKTYNKFRLLSSLDERAEPWTKTGKHTVWHLSLQNENIYNNYGIYANGGLLVESISIRYLKDKSNMTLV